MSRSLALVICVLGGVLALVGALVPSFVLTMIDTNVLLDQNLAHRIREPLEQRCALFAFLGGATLLMASAQLELSIRAQIPATLAVLSAAFAWCWALPHLAAAAAATDLVSSRPAEKALLVDSYRGAFLLSEFVTATCVFLALSVTLFRWSHAQRAPRIIAGMTSVPVTVRSSKGSLVVPTPSPS